MEKLNHLTIPADLSRPSNTIADLGELALIEKIKPFCAAGAIGDDAAIMRTRPEHKLVVTTDMLTENVHFSGRTTPPYTVGWRAAAANLADIAAMGAIARRPSNLLLAATGEGLRGTSVYGAI